MSLIATIALACTVVAIVPVVAGRKRLLLNPALFVFACVAWGVTAKGLYILLFRSRPHAIVYDKVYVEATSTEPLQVGAWLALVAIAAYVSGYFLVGPRAVNFPTVPAASISTTRYTRLAIVGLAALFVVAFFVYLYASGTSLFNGPISAKRFQVRAMGAASRFQYLPYYFFKLAMLSAPLSYAIAYLLTRSQARRDQRFLKAAFAGVFVFALFLSHFASLRLAVTLILVQIGLLLYALRARRLVAFMSVFALLSAASFGVITFSYRAPRDMDVRQQELLELRARAEARDRRRAGNVESSEEAAADRTRTEEGLRSRERRSAAATSSADIDSGIADQAPLVGQLARLVEGPIEGRYFLDFTKLAHIANHFPHDRPHLYAGTLLGVVIPSETLSTDPGAQGLTLDRYLGTQVFGEQGNSVPAGYAGELYIGFGWSGVVLGFLLLGAFHRLLFNQLVDPRTPWFLTACMVVLIPNTTLILLNSGVFPAVSRSVLGIGALVVLGIPDALRRAGQQPASEAKRPAEEPRANNRGD